MMTFWYNISGPSQWPKHCTCIIMSEHNKQLHNIQPRLNQSLLKTILCNIIIIIKIITIIIRLATVKPGRGVQYMYGQEWGFLSVTQNFGQMPVGRV